MSVPTVTAVTPARGHSGGRTLVQVDGTGFRLPPDLPPTGPVPTPAPSVAVTFGGAAATDVEVVSAELLYCLTPEGDPDGGAVEVTVQNRDAAGDPVPGEEASLPEAYTYLRPDLSEESELARVVRALLRSLKRQVVQNVVFTTHTDYDDGTGDQLNFAAVGKLPAIVLANMTVPEDRPASSSEELDVDAPDDRFVSRRPPLVVDVSFTLVGVSNDPVEILNLMQVVRLYFKKNPRLTLPRDKDDPSRGDVSYDLGWAIAGDVGVSHVGDNSNVESFAGQVTVYGVLLEDIPGLPRDKPPGVPDHLPHEATRRFGWKAAADASAVSPRVQRR